MASSRYGGVGAWTIFAVVEKNLEICFKFGRFDVVVDDNLHGGMNDEYIMLLKRLNWFDVISNKLKSDGCMKS